MSLVLIGLALSVALPLAVSDESPSADAKLPLVFDMTETGARLDAWTFTDPDAWRIADRDDRPVLEQHARSQYEPPVRSPYNRALINRIDVSDFVLDLQVRSTGRDYGHRDLCLFFGYQDPSHFYYVHLGQEADPHAHSIFLVNDAPRVSIAEERTDGTPWDDGWHHVRIVRTIEDGRIAVYFDDMETPVMLAHDRSFDHGQIGVGSFDDSGQFDQIRVWGRVWIADAPRRALIKPR